MEALTSVEFWLIVPILIGGMGGKTTTCLDIFLLLPPALVISESPGAAAADCLGGLLVLNNISQIIESKRINGAELFVSLLAIMSCSGRMFFGYVADHFAARLSRPFFLLINS